MAFDESYRRILNKLGYYNYQHGFIVRHLNQDKGWNSHLARCRIFILKAIEIHKPEIVTVLGSGWLLELPVAEMLEKVKKVRLIDIIHPPEVISQAGKLEGVELITEDISGGLIDEVWARTSHLPFFTRLRSLSGIVIPEFTLSGDPGMVISLNILTQLETLPVRRLLRKAKVDDIEFMSFRKEIQEKHLRCLKHFRSVLITDTCEIFTDKSGIVSEKKTVLTDLPEGILREEWRWDFDLRGSDFYNKKSVLNVSAIII